MLDGRNGVGLAFIRSARVVLGSRRRSPDKGLRPQNQSATGYPATELRTRLPIDRPRALRDAKTRQGGLPLPLFREQPRSRPSRVGFQGAYKQSRVHPASRGCV